MVQVAVDQGEGPFPLVFYTWWSAKRAALNHDYNQLLKIRVRSHGESARLSRLDAEMEAEFSNDGYLLKHLAGRS